ncbi:hypothetical protein [Falsiroseomonas sp. HW251]|uniref:hypothetical protein n=1 Tax=Falsiroseomonas sp. HW251 TaxID=3390998 RepID=UPI003D315E22
MPLCDFAARLGVPVPAAGEGRTAPVLADSALDFALDLTSANVDQAAAIYASIWLELYPAMGRPGLLAGFATGCACSPASRRCPSNSRMAARCARSAMHSRSMSG